MPITKRGYRKFSDRKKTPHKKLHIVFGTVNDKDIHKILTLLFKNANYYFCKGDLPRALDALELAAKALALGLKVNIYPSVKSSLKHARKTHLIQILSSLQEARLWLPKHFRQSISFF